MSNVIEFPLSFNEIDKVLQVSEFLDNTEELLKDFQPEVESYLVKEGFFTGPFRRQYREAFDDLIISLIKRQLLKHFNLNGEEMLLFTDRQFIKMVAPELFNSENYKKQETN